MSPHRGHLGTSMGGRVVRRKDLKPKREKPPVDADALSPEALARREANQREQAERLEAAQRREREAQAARAERDAGERVTNAGDALRRHS
jgi:hypothetical protein